MLIWEEGYAGEELKVIKVAEVPILLDSSSSSGNPQVHERTVRRERSPPGMLRGAM